MSGDLKDSLLLITALAAVVITLVRVLWRLRLAKKSVSVPRTVDDPLLKEWLDKAGTSAEPRAVLRELERALVDKKPLLRAKYLFVAGDVARLVLKRPNVAVRYYQRALRINPRCVDALERLAKTLGHTRRWRTLERTCWSVLARLDEEDVGGASWRRCWSILASVYAATARYLSRADAIRKMLAGTSSDGLDELAELADEPVISCLRTIEKESTGRRRVP